MKILLVDNRAEGQTALAKKIDSLDPSDCDSLDLVVSLASDQNFLSRISDVDVIIFGSGLEESSLELARQAKTKFPSIEVIIFVSAASYSSGSFRTAQGAKVRKVIPENASPMDLLQELVTVHSHFCNSGKIRAGRLTVVVQAKGGVGTTTLTAALGEICSASNSRTMLWDLDIESRDLCRALKAGTLNNELISSWIIDNKNLTRESLRDALFSVDAHLNLLMAPHNPAAAMDLVGHPNSVKTVHRLIELARVTHHNIIVDTAGRLGPTTGTLMRAADIILVVIDDSLLGMSAVHAFLQNIMPLVKNNLEALRFVSSGSKLSVREIEAILGDDLELTKSAWSLPPLPFDSAASRWAGTGKTLYGMGKKETRRALVDIARETGMISAKSPLSLEISDTQSKAGKWASRIFGGQSVITPVMRKAD
jgi:cellulose biosynthesis protein BcsQ